MDIEYFSVPLTKSTKNDDGTVTVFGKATGPDLDADLQRMDPTWLAKAMPKWFAEGANVREQHDIKRAAGVGRELSQDGEDWLLKSIVVDPVSADKVEQGVLRFYSIGVKHPQVIKSADAPMGKCVGGDIVEVSLVDRGSNRTCALTMAKAEGGELVPVLEPELVKEMTNGAKRERISQELTERFGRTECWLYMRDWTDSWVVYDIDGDRDAGTFKVDYTIDDSGAVTFGEPVEVMVQAEYTPIGEAAAGDVEATDDVTKADDPTKPAPVSAPELTLAATVALIKSASDSEKAELREALGIEAPADEASADFMAKADGATSAVEALTAELGEVKNRLEKVEAQPAPGGPTLVKTEAVKPDADSATRAEIAEWRRQAGNAVDPDVRTGLLTKAADAEANLTKVA